MTEPVRKMLALADGCVSYLEWEGDGPLLHFAHATGFNAETYKGLLSPLAPRFRIVASDLRGHGFSTLPVRPGLARGWRVYRDDILQFLAALGAAPAILAGHSLGATASLMAAAWEPERTAGLLLAEPVLFPRLLSVMRFLSKWTGTRDAWSLAERAAQRRDSFPSFAAAEAAYKGRGAFKTWGTETIADYLRGGLVADADTHAWKLACSPAWEAETFAATPGGRAALVRRVKCPVVALKGTVASTFPEAQATYLRKAGAHVVVARGASHFLPMEYPELVRHEIERLAQSL